MSTIRGPLYRLKTKDFELDTTRSPLQQQVDRSRREEKSIQSHHHSKLRHGQNFMSKLIRTPEKESTFSVGGDELLGSLIADWRQAGFELSNSTCELQCHRISRPRNTNEAEPVDNTISLGYVQAHTKVSEGPIIETVDRNVLTEKLRLYTMEIVFQSDDAIYPKYCVVGHPDMQERDRWLGAIHAIIERKVELQNGWHTFYRANSSGTAIKCREWDQLRAGQVPVQLNIKARRKARLQNGKVLQDVPIVFEKFSEECCDWPMTRVDGGEYFEKAQVMDASRIIDALAELGLDLSPKTAKRLLDEVQKNPPCPDIPDKIDLKRFMVIFKSCLQEILVSPSAEMKQNLMRIMQDSKNPFLSLLSPDEQMYLIQGRDADGHNVCVCKSYRKDTVLVKQNDEGDSMFLIIEGQLSVVVSFGSGSSITQKEVAVLPAGAVMGEMSLVLGKPRSATCVVKSEAACVAEIAKSAMIKLLDSRPSLARELEDIVYRRDASNYLTAGRAGVNKNNTEAMAAYRVRGDHKPAPAAPAAWAGPGEPRREAAPGGAGAATVCGRPMSRIQSRLSKTKRPMSSCSCPALRQVVTAPPPLDPSPSNRVKSGRWVKGKGVFVFLVD